MIRELTDSRRSRDAGQVFDDVWRPDPSNRVTDTDSLRALSHTGNYVVGRVHRRCARRRQRRFFGARQHDAAQPHHRVSRLGRGRNLGRALKLYQRQWAIDRGLSEITWTFDPLVSRNAYFNLVKLGARPRGTSSTSIGPTEPISPPATGCSCRGRSISVPPVVDPGGPGVDVRGRPADHDHPQGKPG